MPAPAGTWAAIDQHIQLWRNVEEHTDNKLKPLLLGYDGANPGAIDNYIRQEHTKALKVLINQVDIAAENLANSGKRFLDQHVPETWSLGAKSANVGSASFDQVHVAAMAALVDDTHAELLNATTHMTDDLKALVRLLAQATTITKAREGTPAKVAAHKLTERLKATGITAVTYKNGKHVKASTYAEMVVRTKTAVAYNAGALNQYVGAGIRYVEGIDGHACGLVRHDGEPKVSGRVFPIDVAAAYTIGHPSCRRDWAPRSDITSDDEAEVATSWRDPATASDQTSFEKYLVGAGPAPTGKGLGRTPRQPRSKIVTPLAPRQRTPRTPRKAIRAVASTPPTPARPVLTEDPAWRNVAIKKKYTDAEADAIKTYGHGDYIPLNEGLRGLGPNPAANKQRYAKTVQALDRAMKKSEITEPTLVYRGIGEGVIPPAARIPGTILHDKGMVSTTVKAEVTQTFGPLVLRMVLEPGQKAIPMDGERVGRYLLDNEREILLPRGQKYQVKAVTEMVLFGRQKTVLDMEIIP